MPAFSQFAIQADKAIITANPDTGQQLGRITDKPRIRVRVCSSGFTSHFRNTQSIPQSPGSANINRTLHHPAHRKSSILTDHLLSFGIKPIEYLTVLILYPGNVVWSGAESA